MARERYRTGRNIETVTHPFFGRGEVLGERWNGQELLVNFRIGITVWIPVSRLSMERRGAINPPIVKSPPRIGDYEKREMLESFKLGIVPHGSVLNFTYGREEEIEYAKNALLRAGEDGGGCVIVEGEYGAGKTHFLDYIYFYALNMGFAVCKVALDPFDVTPYKPKRVYRELISSFLYRDGREKGFRDFVSWVIGSGILKDNRFFSPFEGVDVVDEGLWDWIEGEAKPRWWLSRHKKTRGLPLLPPFSTAADNYCYILSSLGWALRKLGKKGLVILVDEAETLFHMWWRTVSVEKGINLLRGLAHTALNRLPDNIQGKILRDERMGALVEDLGDVRIIHRGIGSCMTPYMYRKPSGLFLVLAFTPTVASIYSDDILELLDRGVGFIPLKRLPKSAYVEMFHELVDVYRASFPAVTVTEKRVEELREILLPFSERGVRAFLKATVDALDIIRHYPGVSLKRLLG
ncbi:hypothetical protein CH333_10000 [candidate division WOR-3 bacterium JGI_Cruoil_03_44_89]|uniref:Uncharacterized protein n=1 Tax=candidate division WOR-3 bacterium JGI_Cruoil_03_44_89 TaxID=1973748 RepID=A0A235BNK4_UNCW3|nr:MAG: hypothetical protein CH333_10000 [candidate division WOR-3 bacterium JGI_Cruoil_03_44_89]